MKRLKLKTRWKKTANPSVFENQDGVRIHMFGQVMSKEREFLSANNFKDQEAGTYENAKRMQPTRRRFLMLWAESIFYS